MTPLRIFVGYDAREPEAYEVCEASIARRASVPFDIIPLDIHTLKQAGFYRRKWIRRADGQRIDMVDGKPFSTDFTFSRFLVPALSLYRGWAMFCDSDFLFTADIAGLFDLADDRYAAMCVKHEHNPTDTVKMDGQQQTRYRRKNWSSLCLYNCAHPNNSVLTLDCVNKMPGSWLHAFSWLKDDKIGDLPKTWNFLVGVDSPTEIVPRGIHFTLGIPTMAGYSNTPYADLWRTEKNSDRCALPTEITRGIESATRDDLRID